MIELFGKTYITEKEACYIFQLSRSWFESKRLSNTGPEYIKLTGKRKIMYEKTKIEEWFKNLIEQKEKTQ